MKSRILISMLIIALAAAMIGGATMAWFTSTASVTGNTFSAGTVEVSLTEPNSLETAMTPVSASNMAPGDPATNKYFALNNKGSLPMLFRFYLTDVAGTLQDALMVRITLNPAEYPRTFADDEKRQGANNQFVWEGLLKDLNLTNVAAATAGYPLPAGFTDIYEVKIWLPAETGNEFQGATFSGTLRVDAVHRNNQELDDVQWTNNYSMTTNIFVVILNRRRVIHGTAPITPLMAML